MSSKHDWLWEAYGANGDVGALAALATELERDGDLHTAATALDRAFGVDPTNADIRMRRRELLDQLAVVEHGILFRYIPAGSFLMGSETGDADERPVHPVQLDHYWLSQTPISWAAYCRMMDWEAPPNGMPRQIDSAQKLEQKELWRVGHMNKIRLQYCEDETQRAQDWHAHLPPHDWTNQKSGKPVSSRQLFGEPNRADPGKEFSYEKKPMVCLTWADIQNLCEKLSPPAPARKGLLASLLGTNATVAQAVRYRLPTEAEWEKAARGGLIGSNYPWGAEPPTKDRCDFDRFDRFSILPAKQFPANGYGLYAMSGCVWEWTSDWYDAEFYTRSHTRNPGGPSNGKRRVVRGGSWADCAEAVTVSFRMSMGDQGPPSVANPNIGFRLCRKDE